jgi:hypothetical protein
MKIQFFGTNLTSHDESSSNLLNEESWWSMEVGESWTNVIFMKGGDSTSPQLHSNNK